MRKLKAVSDRVAGRERRGDLAYGINPKADKKISLTYIENAESFLGEGPRYAASQEVYKAAFRLLQSNPLGAYRAA
jgi:hypothetical protein